MAWFLFGKVVRYYLLIIFNQIALWLEGSQDSIAMQQVLGLASAAFMFPTSPSPSVVPPPGRPPPPPAPGAGLTRLVGGVGTVPDAVAHKAAVDAVARGTGELPPGIAGGGAALEQCHRPQLLLPGGRAALSLVAAVLAVRLPVAPPVGGHAVAPVGACHEVRYR